MDWIKRNLYFVIGAVVAVVALGAAGYYLYSKWSLNAAKMQQLDQDYATLQQLNTENPHPGSGKIDNVKAVREQQAALEGLISKVRTNFQRIPAIPDSGTNVTSQEFTASLRRTVDQLQKAATNSSVNLPEKYGFSFSAQLPRVVFAAGSLEPLSIQLGEVKTMCDILFAAKINWLDGIRRERVSADDSGGSVADYLLKKSVTNELAVLSPYELTFRCFSTELAEVLEGFANSPHGLFIKSLNVEPAPTTAATDPMGTTPYFQPAYVPPAATTTGPDPEQSAAFARRYGLGARGAGGRYGGAEGAATMGGVPLRMPGAATPYTPPPAYQPGVAPGTQPTTTPRGGLPTVLDEKLIKVTLAVDVIKLLPEGERRRAPAQPAVPDPSQTQPVMNPEAPAFPGA